jgi:hypothetical protein
MDVQVRVVLARFVLEDQPALGGLINEYEPAA